jgi:hypothetical protein
MMVVVMGEVKQMMITTRSDKYPPTSTTNVWERVGRGLILRDGFDGDRFRSGLLEPDPNAGRVGRRVRKVGHL